MKHSLCDAQRVEKQHTNLDLACAGRSSPRISSKEGLLDVGRRRRGGKAAKRLDKTLILLGHGEHHQKRLLQCGSCGGGVAEGDCFCNVGRCRQHCPVTTRWRAWAGRAALRCGPTSSPTRAAAHCESVFARQRKKDWLQVKRCETMEAVSAGASQPRRIFVTVGSTKFTHLVTAVVSRDVIEAVGRAAAVSGGSSSPEVKITIQYGATPLADILTAEGSALVQQQDAGDAARSDADVAAAAALLVREQQQQQADERVTGERDAEDAPTDALSDTALSKMFRLKARSLYDEDSEDDEHRTAHREAQHIATRPAARRGDSNSRAFTFRIPTTAGNTVALELIDFVDNIRPYLETSEIVISHAGA